MRRGLIVFAIILIVFLLAACSPAARKPAVAWQPPTQTDDVPAKSVSVVPIDQSEPTATPSWMAAPPPTLESTRTPTELDSIFADSIQSWNQLPSYELGIEIVPAGEVSNLFPMTITQYSDIFKKVSDSRSLGDPDIIALTAYLRSNGNANFEFTVKKISVVGLGGIWTGNFGKEVTVQEMKDPRVNADMIAQIWLRNMKIRNVTDLRHATMAEIYELAVMYIDGSDNYRGVDYVPSKTTNEAFYYKDRRFTQVSPTAHFYADMFQMLYDWIRANQDEHFNGEAEVWQQSQMGKLVINWQPTPEATAVATPNQ